MQLLCLKLHFIAQRVLALKWIVMIVGIEEEYEVLLTAPVMFDAIRGNRDILFTIHSIGSTDSDSYHDLFSTSLKYILGLPPVSTFKQEKEWGSVTRWHNVGLGSIVFPRIEAPKSEVKSEVK